MLQSYVGLLPPVILKVSWTRHSKIHVKPDTKPIFWKPLTVLFALREAVDKELDRLERLNNLILSHLLTAVNGHVPLW